MQSIFRLCGWLEITDVALITSQLINNPTFNKDSEVEEYMTLKIPVHIAIANLEKRIIEKTKESEDKKQLRKEFCSFLKNEVAENSDLEMELTEISWFYESPDNFFDELIRFHTDPKTKNDYENEIVTPQTIGVNDDFKLFSSVYQKIAIEQQAIAKKDKEQNRLYTDKEQQKEKRSKLLDLITMSLIASVLTFFGVYGIVVKKEISGGLLILFLALICWLYVYLKHIRK